MAGLLTLVVLLGAAAASYRGRSAHRYGAPAHFVVPLSPTTQLSGLDFPSVAISSDGTRLAFVGSRGGQTQLFVRQMNALDATALPGTTNAVSPFFSPDGSWVAFFADGQLKKVALSGGMPITLCEAQVGLGGSWGADDRIVFASNTGSGLSTVPADGGRPQRVTNLDATKGEFSHRWPEWLPGGESVIYTVGTVGTWNQAEIVGQSLTTGERSVLVQGGTNPHYLPTGHLVYAHDGRIFAVPFDPRRLRVTGAQVPVLENVLQSTDGAAQFGFSQAGIAAYVSGELAGGQGKLVSVTRDGAVMPFAAPNGLYSSPRVSADGGTLLVAVETPGSDLWIYDIRSGSFSQRTYDAGATSPVWTPDGRAVFSSTKNGPLNLFISDVSRQGPLERLVASENVQSLARGRPTDRCWRSSSGERARDATSFSCREAIAWHDRCSSRPPTRVLRASRRMAAGSRTCRTTPDKTRCIFERPRVRSAGSVCLRLVARSRCGHLTAASCSTARATRCWRWPCQAARHAPRRRAAFSKASSREARWTRPITTSCRAASGS